MGFFNHFPTKFKVFIFWFACLYVCLSVQAETLVNIHQMFWNLCILLISNIAWITLKMEHKGLTVRLQRQKIFMIYYDQLGDVFKSSLTSLYSTKSNKINMRHSTIQKHVSYKNWIEIIQIFCMQVHTKTFLYITAYAGKFF